MTTVDFILVYSHSCSMLLCYLGKLITDDTVGKAFGYCPL